MRKNFAIIVPLVAAGAIMVACNDPITQPGGTAGAMPIDTLYSRSPIDTFTVAPAMPIDTFASAARAPIDTFAVVQAMPIDTLY